MWVHGLCITSAVTYIHRAYLHASDVYGKHCGEKEHLQEKVRHQPNDCKKAEFLQNIDIKCNLLEL